MEYIRNTITDAGNYLGLNTPAEVTPAGINTAAPGSGAVSASDLQTRKELHRELLETGSENLSSTMPDTAAKSQLHEELLSEKDNILHPVDNSAEVRLEKENYEPIALETLSERRLSQENIKSRPEFQRNPLIFTPAYQSSGSLEEQQSIRGEEVDTFQTMQTREPERFQTIQKEQVVREHIVPIVKEEIQPVVYREREQLDVKQVTQMLHETQIQPTRVEQRQLAPEYRQEVVQSRAPIQENIALPSRSVDATARSTIVHQPIVNEVLKKTVVEEVQPVLERDVFLPTLVQTQVPIYEKIVEAPMVTRETINMQELGTHTAGQRGMVDQSNLYPQSSYPQSSYPQSSYPQSSYSESSYTQSSYSQPSSLSQSSWSSNQMGRVSESELLASRGYGDLASRQQQPEVLATGQVLPAVASTRPAYSYLPRGTADKRPDFIGTSSQYALQANNGMLPKGGNEYVNPLLPQGTNHFNNQVPLSLRRQ